MKIGVFDSGVGGLSVAEAVQAALPDAEVVLREDKEHVPYGTKTNDEIYGFCFPIIKGLADEGCDAIVIACNTVTTNLITKLREQIATPLIGMEPMVKPAAEATKTGVIAVCATPRTLSSARYRLLKDTFAKNLTVLEPDCADWAQIIQNRELNRKKIAGRIEECLDKGADQIVLGCTHYHWIEDLIKEIANGRAQVLQPEVPAIAQLKRVLSRQT